MTKFIKLENKQKNPRTKAEMLKITYESIQLEIFSENARGGRQISQIIITNDGEVSSCCEQGDRSILFD